MIPYVSSEFNTAVANPRGFVGYVGCAWRCPCRDLGKEAWAVQAVCHRAGAGEDNRAATEFGSGSGGEGQGCEGSHRHLHVCLQPEHWNASTTDPVISVTSYTREEKGRERGREPESKMPGRTELKGAVTCQNTESRSSPTTLRPSPQLLLLHHLPLIWLGAGLVNGFSSLL